MELRILGQSLLFENKIDSVSKIFEKIEKLIEGTDLIFSHLNVDDKEVFSDYEDYILDRINDVKNIEVVIKNRKEWIDDLLMSSCAYLDRALPEIKQMANQFYMGPTGDNWSNFEELLESIQWLAQMAVIMEENKSLYANWTTTVLKDHGFKELLGSLSGAVNSKDTVLIADIIHYELAPLLEALRKDIVKTISHEVTSNDVN